MDKSRNAKVMLGFCFIFLFLLAACRTHEEYLNESLKNLNVEKASDFAILSPCKQIEIYAILGSEYTDVDHMTVIIPKWMQDEIDKHPDDIVAACIVDEANSLLSQWGTNTKENRKISYSIHALLYKANELDINKHPQLEGLFHRAVCQDKVFYDGQLILIYYTAKHGFANIPNHEVMVSTLCK